ncbi:MAG: hypothetical protein E7A81_00500 [Clostridiales bacterium]|nr:hypothetical protein [Clostridiales bacterium]MDU1041605.1 hypothetical protein [Clostridiales bacterium]
MVREVELIKYLPDYVADYREIKSITIAEDPEFKLVWNEADNTRNNQFLDTCDEVGLSRFEKLLSLKNEIKSVDMRKVVVRSKLLLQDFDLISYLSSLYGSENFSVLVKGYNLYINLFTKFDDIKKELEATLKEMVPVNMITNITYEKAMLGIIYQGGIICQADVFRLKEVK